MILAGMMAIVLIAAIINFIKLRFILRRQTKVYLATVAAMESLDLWNEMIAAGMTSNDVYAEIVLIAGDTLFSHGLGKRIQKSKLSFIHEYYLKNEKNKAFEKEIKSIKLELK